MTEFNEAKVETLQDIYDQGEVSASDLAYTYGLTLQNASTRLRRYCRQGLLGRWKEGREYVYYITDRGVERLEWLSTNRISGEWLNYTNRRCPVEKTRALDIAVDERNYESDFDDIESNEDIDQDFMSEDDDEVIESYEVDEDDDEDHERYPSEEEGVDSLYNFLKNIKRCRVNRDKDLDIDEEIA